MRSFLQCGHHKFLHEFLNGVAGVHLLLGSWRSTLTARFFPIQTLQVWVLLFVTERVSWWPLKPEGFPKPIGYSPVVIEALAALHGLQLVRDFGFTNAVLEGDSLQIMSALQSGCEVLSHAGLLIDEARHSSQFFQKLLYSHVRREDNKVAYFTAWYASNIFDFVVWTETVPFTIYDLVLNDSANLP